MAADRQVDTGLAGFLGLLERHRVSVDLVGDVGYPVRALAATDGCAGVLALLAGGELWLTGVRPAELATAIVGLLPAGSCRMAGRFGISTGDGERVEPADHVGIERRVAALLSTAVHWKFG